MKYVPVIGNRKGFAEFCKQKIGQLLEANVDFRQTPHTLEADGKLYFFAVDAWALRGKRFTEAHYVYGHEDLEDIDMIRDEVSMRIAHEEKIQAKEDVVVTIEYKGKKYTSTRRFTDVFLKNAGDDGMIEEVSRGAMKCMRDALDDIKEAK